MSATDRPRGIALWREIRDYLARTGTRQTDFARAAGVRDGVFSNLTRVSFPKPDTVDAARRVMRDFPTGVPVGHLGPERHRDGAFHLMNGAAALERARCNSLAPAQPVMSAAAARASDAAPQRPPSRVSFNRTDLSTAEAISSALVEQPNDLIALVKVKWPRLWGEVIEQARAAGRMPGAVLFEAIERGLEIKA